MELGEMVLGIKEQDKDKERGNFTGKIRVGEEHLGKVKVHQGLGNKVPNLTKINSIAMIWITILKTQ